MFRESRIITGIKTKRVKTIAMNVLIKSSPINKFAITNVATANATPTP